jgi:hypothetical protein
VTAEVLTTGRLNRALLARQLLLNRAAVSIPAALEAMGGIQNQYAPNAYIRLWSCLEGFRRDDLTRAYESGTAVQGTLMRGTIHAVAAADYHPFAAGLREHVRAWARRLHSADDSGRDDAVARVRAALAGRTAKRAEVDALLEDAGPAVRQTIDTDVELLRVPPSGTWERRRADLCGLADDVVGGHVEVAPRDGLAHILRRYLGGFGPSTVREMADFAGVPVTPIREAVASLELVAFRSEDGAELLDLPGAPLPDELTPAPVRFLPTWDAALLVHARRTQILPEEYRSLIFHTKMPPSYPTFLVDGRVAGTWRYVDGEVETVPFAPLPAGVDSEVRAEAARLADFHRGDSPR